MTHGAIVVFTLSYGSRSTIEYRGPQLLQLM
jgi:hypothetical protein